MAPPDEALEQRFARIDERFDLVDQQITEAAAELKEELKELKQAVKALRVSFQRGNFALVISVIGVLLATILKGG